MSTERASGIRAELEDDILEISENVKAYTPGTTAWNIVQKNLAKKRYLLSCISHCEAGADEANYYYRDAEGFKWAGVGNRDDVSSDPVAFFREPLNELTTREQP